MLSPEVHVTILFLHGSFADWGVTCGVCLSVTHVGCAFHGRICCMNIKHLSCGFLNATVFLIFHDLCCNLWGLLDFKCILSWIPSKIIYYDVYTLEVTWAYILNTKCPVHHTCLVLYLYWGHMMRNRWSVSKIKGKELWSMTKVVMVGAKTQETKCTLLSLSSSCSV